MGRQVGVEGMATGFGLGSLPQKEGSVGFEVLGAHGALVGNSAGQGMDSVRSGVPLEPWCLGTITPNPGRAQGIVCLSPGEP